MKTNDGDDEQYKGGAELQLPPSQISPSIFRIWKWKSNLITIWGTGIGIKLRKGELED